MSSKGQRLSDNGRATVHHKDKTSLWVQPCSCWKREMNEDAMVRIFCKSIYQGTSTMATSTEHHSSQPIPSSMWTWLRRKLHPAYLEDFQLWFYLLIKWSDSRAVSEVSSGGAHHPKLLSIVWGLGDPGWEDGPTGCGLGAVPCGNQWPKTCAGKPQDFSITGRSFLWFPSEPRSVALTVSSEMDTVDTVDMVCFSLRRFLIAFWPTLWSRLDRQSLGRCSAFTPSSGIQEPLSRFGSICGPRSESIRALNTWGHTCNTCTRLWTLKGTHQCGPGRQIRYILVCCYLTESFCCQYATQPPPRFQCFDDTDWSINRNDSQLSTLFWVYNKFTT